MLVVETVAWGGGDGYAGCRRVGRSGGGECGRESGDGEVEDDGGDVGVVVVVRDEDGEEVI